MVLLVRMESTLKWIPIVPLSGPWWWSERASCHSCITSTPLSLRITVCCGDSQMPWACWPPPLMIPSAPPKAEYWKWGAKPCPYPHNPSHLLLPRAWEQVKLQGRIDYWRSGWSHAEDLSAGRQWFPEVKSLSLSWGGKCAIQKSSDEGARNQSWGVRWGQESKGLGCPEDQPK